jgi:hypothetical protein
MARWNRLIPALAVTFALAACGHGTADTPFAPSAPRLDGGGTSLGGNATPPTGEPESTTSSTTTNSEVPTDSTSRTGGTSLGGN